MKPSIDCPFVSLSKLEESIDVLKKWSQIRVQQVDDKIKKPLIEDESELIKLQIELKKIPFNRTTYIHTISLPNHWRHESDFESCLIVKDINKKPLTDRELDLDITKSHYKELLEKQESDQLVDEILPMRELRNEYKVFEAKQKLCNAFDVFLCDRKLMHNKFDYLPLFLGKTFWLDSKKVPIPIDLNDNNLKSQLELKLNQTFLYLSGKGNTSTVNIGSMKQTTERIAQNLLAVTKKLYELFGNNVRSLRLKTEKSKAITFFLDCGFVSDTKLERPKHINEPIEDEFSHFINSNIQVFSNGEVKVVDRKDDNCSDEEIDEFEKEWISKNKKTNKRKRKSKKRNFNLIKSNKKPKLSKKGLKTV